MLLDFSYNNINILFEVTDKNDLYLLNFSTHKPICEPEDKNKRFFPATEIQITGKNPDDHHGAKHTGTYGSTSLKYQSHRFYNTDSGKKLEITVADGEIEAVLNYELYKGLSAARSYVEITNISNENVGIEYLSSFTLTGIDSGSEGDVNDKIKMHIPHNSWVRETAWQEYTLSELGFNKITPFSTKRISVSNTGTWSSKEFLPMGALTDTNSGETYLWQIESNGSWQWEIGDIADNLYLKLSGPTESENHWYKALKPNEKFVSVKAAVAFGNGFDSALENMTGYRRLIAKKIDADKNLPVIFNDYMNCLWAEPTTEKEIPVIDKAAEMGAEYYCMDAGWYADGTWWETVGEWQPCDWRFPNGIKEVFDYIRRKGMIPGIWLEIEVMGVNCPILDKFDDDCFFMRHGKRIIDHGRYQLDFRNEKVVKFATEVVDRVVAEYGVGYIKMDYNIDAGIGTELNSDSAGDGLLQHNRAYLKWIDDISKKYPDLIIENCSSGGMRMDYAMLSHHTIQSVTDQESYKNTAVIAAAAGTAVLPEQGAIWSYPKAEDDENAVAFNMVNAMLTRMHLSGEIYSLDDNKLELVKSGVEAYKNLRGDIKSFVPFYPIGLPSYSDGWICVGYKADSDYDYIAVWRRDAEDSSIKIPIENAKGVEVVYPNLKGISVNCDRLGIEVKLDSKYSAVVCKIKK